MGVTKWDYCQYLLSSPVNYTLTNMADHVEGLSHDKLNRYLRGEQLITGIESCQCRKAALQRNHIHCALLVWTRLDQLAAQTQSSFYQLKHNLLRDFLIQQLTNPSLDARLA